MKLTFSCLVLMAVVCATMASSNFFQDMAQKAGEFMSGGSGKNPMEAFENLMEQGGQAAAQMAEKMKDIAEKAVDPQQWRNEMEQWMQEAANNPQMKEVKEGFEKMIAEGMKPQDMQSKMMEIMNKMKN